MKHELKQGLTRSYTLKVDGGVTYTAKFQSLRPARKWAKSLLNLTNSGGVLLDFMARPVLRLEAPAIAARLHAEKSLYRRSLTTVAMAVGKKRKK